MDYIDIDFTVAEVGSSSYDTFILYCFKYLHTNMPYYFSNISRFGLIGYYTSYILANADGTTIRGIIFNETTNPKYYLYTKSTKTIDTKKTFTLT